MPPGAHDVTNQEGVNIGIYNNGHQYMFLVIITALPYKGHIIYFLHTDIDIIIRI